MLTLIPQGGLCNRMRAIESAIVLSKASHSKLIIQWHKDPGLNCDFEKLFKRDPELFSIQTLNYNGIFSQLKKSVRKRLYRYTFDRYFSEEEIYEYIKKESDLPELISKSSICIASCSHFFNSNNTYRTLKPLDSIIDVVDKLIPESEYLVGVHIRRTDHKVARQYSPISLFENAMNKEIMQNDKVKFFLATDSVEVNERLEKIFPGRIIFNSSKSYARTDEPAIIDALIDVYCLSRTTKILGSYGSSFSEEAAKIGNIELDVLTVPIMKEGVDFT